MAPGVSTACGWTGLRGTESSGVRKGTPVPVEWGAAEKFPALQFEINPIFHTPGEGQECGSWNQPSLPNTRSLPILTADGAAESSLLFVRFPSPGTEKQRNWEWEKGGHSQIPLRQPSFRRPVCPESAVGKEQAWAPTEFRGPREAFLRAPVSTSRGKDWEWVGRATKGIEGRLPRDCLFQLDDLGQVILPPCASVFSSVKRG